MSRAKVPLCLFLSAVVFGSGCLTSFAWDDRAYAFRVPSAGVNDFQNLVNPLNSFVPVVPPSVFSAQIPSFLTPDFAINTLTLRAPELVVRDVGSELYSYKWDASRFNADLRLYDRVQATIRPITNEPASAGEVHLDFASLTFENGRETPESFRQMYTDTQGNSLRVERTRQTSVPNPSYDRFICRLAAGARATKPRRLPL